MQLRWVGAIVIAFVFLTSAACIGAIVLIGVTQTDAPSGDHVAVIEIHGQFAARDSGGLFSGESPSAERIIEQLETIREDGNAQAVLLDIDSPGSTAIAAEQIHTELMRVKDAGIPIISYFGSSATSGAYYIAAPSEVIVANPGTVTGSIGVITQVPNMEELFEKIGIEMQIIATGEYKDMMQPARPLRDDEIDLIQELQNETYEEFIDVISSGRDMSESEVRELADGRVFSGRQAVENGLVDELGDLREAIRIAGEVSGLGDDPTLRDYSPSPPGIWDVFMGVTTGDFELDFPSIFGPEIDPRDVHLEIRLSPQ
jgi:protease IV